MKRKKTNQWKLLKTLKIALFSPKKAMIWLPRKVKKKNVEKS